MATQLKIRRGTTAEHASFTGAEGEITLDTTKDTLVAHDNYTAGGRPMLREDLNNLANNSIEAVKISRGSSKAGQALVVNQSGTAVEFSNKINGAIAQVSNQWDDTSYSISNSWVTGKTWTQMTGITVGNDLRCTFNIYARNDSTSWGGGYTTIEYATNSAGDNWADMGSDGYSSGNVMINGPSAIGQSERTFYIENYQYTQIRFRYKHKSYDGTYAVNNAGENDLGVSPTQGNFGGGPYTRTTAALPDGNHTNSHWNLNRFLIEEIQR